MTANRFFLLCAALIVVSISAEMVLLSGMAGIAQAPYHVSHLLLMGALVVAQVALYVRHRHTSPVAHYALWLAAGLGFTLVGDYVNGALSGIEPVSLKLSWALLWFGLGYGIYVLTLLDILRRIGVRVVWSVPYLAMAAGTLAVNVCVWLVFVEQYVRDFDVLCYGSFAFNAVIYVLLPVLANHLFNVAKMSAAAVFLLLGAFLLPFSDLVLFSTWLIGNPPVPSFEHYAINWVLYFSGQAFFSMLSAWIIVNQQSLRQAVAADTVTAP